MSCKILIAHVDGEEDLAEELAIPLRSVGFEVEHRGTVLVGDSVQEAASKVLNLNGPVVLCGTIKALGTGLAHHIVNAARSRGSKIFAVQMEKDAYLTLLALDEVVACYWQDPEKAKRDLITSLQKHYPPQAKIVTEQKWPAERKFMDQITSFAEFDSDILIRFRGQLRADVKETYPDELTPLEFLTKANLMLNGNLTRTGVLMFGKNLTTELPSSIIQCVRYYGTDRSAPREKKQLNQVVFEQILAAHDFIASRIIKIENPVANRAESETKYEYPMICVREIIANAIAHRNYEDMERVIHINLFSDRIEIINPGYWLAKKFPEAEAQSLLDLKTHSIKRNITLANVLSWINLVECEGSGIPAAIKNCMEMGAPIPKVTQEEGFVTVTIWPSEKQWMPVQYATSLIPHQIPQPPVDFTGRETEINALLIHFNNGINMICLRGIGGIGKTTLAFKLAEKLRELFPDGQIMVDLKGTSKNPLAITEAMAQVIRSYDPTALLPKNEAELRGLFLSILDGKRTLLLLDNAVDSNQLRQFGIPSTCGMIITSRRRFIVPGLTTMDLDKLEPTDSVNLIKKIYGTLSSSNLQSENELWAEIASMCGYLPLALRAAGSLLANTPDLNLSQYVERLRAERTRLEYLGQEGLDLGVEANFNLSYNCLSVDAARVFRMLSVFHSQFDAKAEELVCQDEGHHQLNELMRWSLVEHQPGKGSGESRYFMHDLARLFASAKLEEEDKIVCESVQQRHAAYYQNVLWEANRNYLEGGSSLLYGLMLFDSEWANIRAGQIWAETHMGMSPKNALICSSFAGAGSILNLRLHPLENLRWIDAALISARQLGNPVIESIHLGNMGNAYAALGETRKAIELYEQHLSIVRKLGDRRGEGADLGNMGNVYAAMGEIRRAVDLYEQALAIAHEIGDRRSESAFLGSLGNAYSALGETGRATELFEQSLAIAREIGDRRGEGNALGNLGNAYVNLGKIHLATQLYEKHLAIAREIGDKRSEGNALVNLGLAYAKLGETRLAIKLYEQRLAIAREIGDRRGEGNVLGNLGLAYADLGEIRQAIDFYGQALAMAREIGDLKGEGIYLGSLGNAYAAMGEIRLAIELYEQRLVIANRIGDRRGKANALSNLGLAYSDLGEITQAIGFYRQALNIARDISDFQSEGNILFNMCLALENLGKHNEAIESAKLSLVIFERIESPYAERVRRKLLEWQK